MIDFPGGASGKNLLANQEDVRRDLGLIPMLGRFPWRRAWQSTPVFFPGESHGQRSLVGYSPWGHKESDTTEATQHAPTASGHIKLTSALGNTLLSDNYPRNSHWAEQPVRLFLALKHTGPASGVLIRHGLNGRR